MLTPNGLQAIAVHTFLIVFWGMGVDSDPSTGAPAPTPISVWIARMVVITLWLLTIVLTAALAAEHRSAQEHFYGPRPVSLMHPLVDF
jgi:hypothetical protein